MTELMAEVMRSSSGQCSLQQSITFVDFTRYLTTFWSPKVAVSVTKLPETQGHRSYNGVFRAEMMV